MNNEIIILSNEDENRDKKDDDELLGCRIMKGDTPLIIASFACYASFIVYGASAALLGAALPELCIAFDVSEKVFGIAFTLRGTGYFAGTMASAGILEIKKFFLSKQLIVCLAVALTGFANGMITISKTYEVVFCMIFLQGISFGFIDTFANCVMPELWGKRVQPWMQALHACFGIGSVIGPSVVGSLGWRSAFIVISIFSIVPVLGLATLLQYQSHYNIIDNEENLNEMVNDNDNDNEIKNIEETKQSNINENCVNKEVPLSIRVLIATFFFFYVGLECGYGGWITTYVLEKNITESSSDAAYTSAIYWGSLTGGRILAIILALFMKGHTMLKVQLLLTGVGCVLIITISHISYNNACIASAVIGFALSSIFPLAMLLCQELNFSQSDRCTTLFVIGACIGEGAIPAIIGALIGNFGANLLPYSVIACTLAMFVIYLTVIAIANNINNDDRKNIEIKEILST